MSEHSEQLSHEDLTGMAEGISRAEAERVHKELEEGRDALDIVDELGGQENVNRILDANNARYLEGRVKDEERLIHENLQEVEDDVQTQILEMKQKGNTPDEIIDHFGGFEQLERLIGTPAARGLIHETEIDGVAGELTKIDVPSNEAKGEN